VALFQKETGLIQPTGQTLFRVQPATDD